MDRLSKGRKGLTSKIDPKKKKERNSIPIERDCNKTYVVGSPTQLSVHKVGGVCLCYCPFDSFLDHNDDGENRKGERIKVDWLASDLRSRQKQDFSLAHKDSSLVLVHHLWKWWTS